MTLSKDDRVIVPLMPHLGTGVVDMVVPYPFDRVLVRFRLQDEDGHDEAYLDDFAPAELAPAPLVKHA